MILHNYYLKLFCIPFRNMKSVTTQIQCGQAQKLLVWTTTKQAVKGFIDSLITSVVPMKQVSYVFIFSITIIPSFYLSISAHWPWSCPGLRFEPAPSNCKTCAVYPNHPVIAYLGSNLQPCNHKARAVYPNHPCIVEEVRTCNLAITNYVQRV